MNKIDIFLVGVQKAGTTSLYNWLGQHPQIDAPDYLKDYHFFSDDSIYLKASFSYLEDNYRKKGKNVFKLHGAVNYIYFNHTVKRLYDYNPEAKIIISLRNPVDRFLSGFRYTQQLGIEKRTWENAIQAEQAHKNLSPLSQAFFNYLDHGKYLEKMKEYMDLFGKEKVHIIYFEDFQEDPRKVNDIFKFIGVESKFEFDPQILNSSGHSKIPQLNRLLYGNSMFQKRVRPYWRKLPLPFRIKVVKTISRINYREGSNWEPPKELVSFLRNYYREEVEKLSEVLGIDLVSKWGLYE